MDKSIQLVEGKIKSVDLVEIINTFREEESRVLGKEFKELRHDSFMEKVKKEVSLLKHINPISLQNFMESDYVNGRGKRYPCYSLTRDGMLEMLNSESVYCRAKTIEYINKLEEKISTAGNMTKEIQAIFALGKKADEFDNRLEKLENNMTIDYGQQLDLNNLAKNVVMQFIGGKDVPAYKKYTKKMFSKLWKDYKRVLNVNSYKNTAVKDYISAKKFILNWQPPEELKDAIRGCNCDL